MLTVDTFTYSLWHIVATNVFMLFLLSVFIYQSGKDRVFLLYGLYNLFLLGYLILKNDRIFPGHLYTSILPINWAIQIVYNAYLSYFGISFLNLKLHYPKAVKNIERLIKVFLILGGIGCFLALIFKDTYYFYRFFLVVYFPLQLGVSFYLIYLALKVTEREKYYYFAGIVSYITFAIFAFVLSATGNYYVGKFTAVSFFYIGILIEGIVFAIGLKKRVKNIYKDKFNVQKELTSVQKALNKELKDKIKKIEIEKQLVDLEFTLMTSKMNSHFLFNALNSIKLYIIENEKLNAISYLSKFSEFIRKVLETSSVKIITLEEELYISQLYMDIENTRFDGTITFSIKTDKQLNLKNIQVPPFILQPFLENAIWHGIASKKDKEIMLSLFQKDENVFIEITDNGIGRKRAQQIKQQKNSYKKSMGLQIVTQILTNFYSDKFHLEYVDLHHENNEPKGTKVILTIPLQLSNKSLMASS